MTRWIPLLVVAAASIPPAWADDRPLPALQARFPASPPGGPGMDSDGLGMIPRGDLLSEGSSLAGRFGWDFPAAVLDLFPRAEGATAVRDARDMADARIAHYLVARAFARAREGDLPRATRLQEGAILFYDGEPIRTKARRDPATIRKDELEKARERMSYFTFSLATIDGLPPGCWR
jgi:hypothetical protein